MVIRALKNDELSLLFQYSALEGWDNEKVHTKALYHSHPDDFLIIYKNKLLIGFILAVKHSDKFGFISNLLVLKEFRGLGYGKKIFDYALKHLDGCQIALDSVVGKETLYEKFCFKSYFDVVTYKFISGSVSLPQTDFEVVDFDKNLSLKDQNIYMAEIILSKETTYKAIKNKEKISSFALAFHYIDGYKVHIESEDINEAITLFFTLTKTYKKGTAIYLQASALSPMLQAIVELLKMKADSKSIRMYNFIL